MDAFDMFSVQILLCTILTRQAAVKRRKASLYVENRALRSFLDGSVFGKGTMPCTSVCFLEIYLVESPMTRLEGM